VADKIEAVEKKLKKIEGRLSNLKKK